MAILYVFVEGEQDKDFFHNFIASHLSIPTPAEGCFRGKKTWLSIQYVKYAGLTPLTVSCLISSIIAKKDDYIIIGDADYLDLGNPKWSSFPKTYKGCVDYLFSLYNHSKSNMFIVVEEIEGWYLAGFNSIFSNSHIPAIVYYPVTEIVTKELFSVAAVPLTHRQLMNNLISHKNNFIISHGKTRNDSFRLFCDAMGL